MNRREVVPPALQGELDVLGLEADDLVVLLHLPCDLAQVRVIQLLELEGLDLNLRQQCCN